MEPLKGTLWGFLGIKTKEMWECWCLKPTTGSQWGCLKFVANGETVRTLIYTVCGAASETESESVTLK